MLPADHFEALYASSPDPWGYGSRWYERRKHALTVACLPAERYRRAFEPGCSTGVLTTALSARCDHLVAADMSPSALHRAREATSSLCGVEVRQLRVPEEWPEGAFDLVILSELGYYLDPPGLELFIERTQACLSVGGHLVAVHWRGISEDFLNPDGAQDVHARLLSRPGWARVVSHHEADFMIDVLEWGP